MRSRSITFALTAAALILPIAGCSSNSTPSPAPSTTTPTAAAPSDTVLPPIIIDGTKTKVNAKVGDSLDVTIKDIGSVYTSNPQVLKITQPTTANGATFNGGAEVIGVGTAEFSANGKDGGVFTVTVIATE